MAVEAEVTLPDGRKVTVKGPTKEAVQARIDALRQPAPEVPRETQSGFQLPPMLGGRGKVATDPYTLGTGGALELAMTLGSATAAEPVSGIAGLATAPHGIDKGVDAVRNVQSALTYTPTTPSGSSMARGLSAFAEPALGWLEDLRSFLGNETLEITGSPALAAAADIAPIAALELLGFLGINKARGVRKVTGLSDDIVQDLAQKGKVVDDLTPDELKALQVAVRDEAAAAARRAETLERVGVTQPTRAQITRSADDFQLQQELAKTNTPVRQRLEAQQAQVSSRIEDVISETGGQPAGASAIDEVVGRSTLLDDRVSQLYQIAREQSSDAQIVRPDRLAEFLRQNASSNELTNGLIRSTRGFLEQNGILDKFKVTGKINVSKAEEIVQFINSQYDSTTPFGRRLSRGMKDALDEDVLSAGSDNSLQIAARNAKANYESGLDRAKVSKFDQRKTNLVRDMLENKVSADSFVDDVVFRKKYRSEDLRQLKEYLQQSPNGEMAWNDIRAETLDMLREKIFKGPVDANDVGTLSRPALDQTLKRIGDAKLSELFSPTELEFLSDLQEAAKLMQPVKGTALGRGPSAQAINKLDESLKTLVPIFGERLVEIKDAVLQNGEVIKTLAMPQPTPLKVTARRGAGVGGAAAIGATTTGNNQQREPAEQ